MIVEKNRNWFRLLLVMAVMLLLAGFTFTSGVALAQDESPFSADVVTATTTGNLNLRAGPGTQHQILATLPQGTIVGFTGFTDSTRNWVQVDSIGNPVGWASAAFLSNVPAELQVPPTDTDVVDTDPVGIAPGFSADVVTAMTTGNLNLRAGPGTQHQILATLPQGSVVGFTGLTDSTGNWVQVDSAGNPVGWVAGAFLSQSPADLQVQSADVVADEADGDVTSFSPAVVTATTIANLNIRQGPGTEFQILDTLPRGTVVGFTGLRDTTGNWVQVDAVDGPVGWVSAAFLSNVPTGLTIWQDQE